MDMAPVKTFVFFSLMALFSCTESYDLVILNGRVIDPESGLDAARNIGIRDGKIALITSNAITGTDTIDAAGLVVSPGFIDLHAHGQDSISNRLQVADGVTTALELELGVYPLKPWLQSREGKAIINYGASVGHLGARIKHLTGFDAGHMPLRPPEDTAYQAASLISQQTEIDEQEVDAIAKLLSAELDAGALGIGFGIAYAPSANRTEIFRLFQFAAQQGVPVFTHLRNFDTLDHIAPFQEVIANVAATGASLHIVHINSTAAEDVRVVVELIRGARARGLDITAEAYPYTASSTKIESAFFDDWKTYSDERIADFQWPTTGERLTRETFGKYRAQGGWVIIHGERSEETNAWIVAQPDIITASDGIPFLYGIAHPRGAGTFSRILGYYVREQKTLSLMDALKKMTLLPAQRLEGISPQMRNKGRIREGADADITMFDPQIIIDKADYTNGGNVPSDGVMYVMVGGVLVVSEGKIVEGVLPGKAIVKKMNE
jgi:dihydroorotase